MNTITINKWWDSLTHEQKEILIKEMNKFHWGKPIAIHAINKNQKAELYKQVHDPEYLENLKKRIHDAVRLQFLYPIDKFFGW